MLFELGRRHCQQCQVLAWCKVVELSSNFPSLQTWKKKIKKINNLQNIVNNPLCIVYSPLSCIYCIDWWHWVCNYHYILCNNRFAFGLCCSLVVASPLQNAASLIWTRLSGHHLEGLFTALTVTPGTPIKRNCAIPAILAKLVC